MHWKPQFVLFLIAALVLSSCTTPVGSRPTDTITPTSTPEPTSTPTPSPTPLSQEEVDAILQAYKLMILVQVEGEMLYQTAERVASGDLSGMNEMVTLVALASVTKSIDESYPQITPPAALAESWPDILGVHEQIKDVFQRWVDQTILSTQVVEEMPAILAEADSVLIAAEESLASEYNLDASLLSQNRDEIRASVNALFTTPTPTP